MLYEGMKILKCVQNVFRCVEAEDLGGCGV